MYCVFAKESIDKMESNVGKLSAQAGHAFLHAWWDAASHKHHWVPEGAWEYKESNDARKIVLFVPTVDDLRKLQKAYSEKCGTSLVEDCGYTIFTEPTITCLGIGPLHDKDKGEDLASLPTLTAMDQEFRQRDFL